MIFCFIGSLQLQAQDFELGFMLGGAYYQGDMVEGAIDFAEGNIAYGLFVRKYVTEKWSVRATVYRGKLSGDDRNFRPDRGFRFVSNFNELSLMGEYILLGSYAYGATPDRFNIYLYGGGAVTTLNTKLVTELKEMSPFVPAFTDATLALPMGGGLRLNFNGRTAISGELGFRPTITDLIDGLEIGGKDFYMIGNFAVTLILGDY